MSISFTSYKQASKKDWGKTDTDINLNLDQINTGSIMRIADAVEKMAMDHDLLIRQRDDFRRWYEDEKAEKEFLLKRISSMKGVITKLKKQIKL